MNHSNVSVQWPECKTLVKPIYLVSEKKFWRLAGCGIKSMRPIFKTEM